MRRTCDTWMGRRRTRRARDAQGPLGIFRAGCSDETQRAARPCRLQRMRQKERGGAEQPARALSHLSVPLACSQLEPTCLPSSNIVTAAQNLDFWAAQRATLLISSHSPRPKILQIHRRSFAVRTRFSANRL